MIILLYGIIIGLLIGTTVGPVALLCIQQSIQNGARAGIIIGIGATIAQLLFASTALFGMHFVRPFFDSYEHWIQLFSSSIIAVIAVHIFRLPVAIAHPDQQPISTPYASTLFTSFIITLSGPASIASYALFITFLELQFNAPTESFRFLSGVVIGNFAWWIPVSFLSRHLIDLLSRRYFKFINKIAAFLLAILALMGIARAFYGFMQ